MPDTALEVRSIILLKKVEQLDTKADLIVDMLCHYISNCYYQGSNIDGNKLMEYATRVQKLTVEKEATLQELNK